MKKKLCILLLALAALLALTVGAQAADLNTYATARFDQSWPCYSGPGEYYFRATARPPTAAAAWRACTA